MKKIRFLFVLCCMLLVGCSKEKSISCTNEHILQKNAYQSKYILKYQKDKLVNLEYDVNVIIEQGNMDNYDIYYEAFNDAFNNLGNQKGTLVNIGKNNDGYNANIKIDYNKFKGNTSFFNNKLKINEAKKYLEGMGYKCK